MGNRFNVVRSGFKGGYYFREGDEIKIEQVSTADLLEMADDIKQNSKGTISDLIFYDLDSVNLIQYEKDIFKKISGAVN